jgi:hypothetical protein
MGEKFRKKGFIAVIHVYENGNRLVMNESNPDDQWVIPKEVFESTYEKVE